MRLHRAKSIAISGCLAFALFTAATPALAAGVTPAQATPVQREQAQSRFLRGKEKLAKNQFEAALVEFGASLEIVTSPNTRLYVGRCQRELGRLVAAYVEFGRTEVEAKELSRDDPRYEKAGQSAHEERAKLEPLLGFLNIEIAHASDATKLKVAGDEIRPAGWSEPIPVMPGTAEVVVETPDQPAIHRSVAVAAAERKAVSIDAAEGKPVAALGTPATTPPAKAAAEASGPTGLRKAAYITGGAAIVGLGVFAFFGLKANSSFSDLQTACNSGPCPPGHEGQISDGRTQQTIANVGLVFFAVGAAATATLWVISAPSAKTSSGTSARLDVGPSFSGLRGSF